MSDDSAKAVLVAILGVCFIALLAFGGAHFFGTPGGNSEPGYMRESDRR